MTKLAMRTDSRRQEGAAKVAPFSDMSLPSEPRKPNRTVVLVLATICLIVALGRLAWFAPPVQEWRLGRLTLSELLKERGGESNDSRLLYYVGLRLNEVGRFADAEPNLRRAVGLEPESARLRDEWARALLGVGNISEAFNQLQQFVGLYPNSGEAHLALGKFYFAQKSMVRAREELEKAVALKPDSAEAWAYLSQAAGQLSLPDLPRKAAEKAVALAPNNARYRLVLASLLEAASDPTAGVAFAKAASLAPNDAGMHQQYARWLLAHADDAGNRATAEVELQRALTLNANDGLTQLLCGRLLRDTGRTAEAIAPLTKATALSPDDPAPAQALVQVYTTLGKTTDTEKWKRIWQERQSYVTERHALFQELRVDPDSRPLRAKMAELLGRHGDVDGCVRNYATALRRPPDSTQVLVAATHALVNGGHADLAVPLARRAVEQGKSSPEAHEALGDALLQTGQLDEAIKNYNYTTNYSPHRATEIQKRVDDYVAAHPQPVTPAEQAYRDALALIKGQIGLERTPTRALELADQAQRLDPGNLVYLRFLLRLQFGARKTEDAIKTARQVVRIDPMDGYTQALLGVMLADRATTPEQVAETEAFLEGAKNTPNAQALRHYGIGLLALRQRDGKRAVTELTEAARLDPDADVTFYKLSQAHQLNGDAATAARVLATYEQRQKLRQEEFRLQGDISQRPKERATYAALLAFYTTHGRKAEAQAMQTVIQHRFADKSTRSEE